MDGLMKARDYTSGPARCRVRPTMGVPAHMRPYVRELSSLEVPGHSQGNGHATRLVQRVCRDADEALLMLVLWPRPWGDHVAMSQADLVAWYERSFGFEVIQAEPLLMARSVGAGLRKFALHQVAAAVSEAVH